MSKRRLSIANLEEIQRNAVFKDEQRRRNQRHVEQGILSDEKFGYLADLLDKNGFQSVMATTLGKDFGSQGLLRPIQYEDLVEFERKIISLEGKYRGGIKAETVINSSLATDRARASKEIGWAIPVSSRYLPANESLVVSFTTAASGKYGANKHFVNVEFTQFKQYTTHRLMREPNKKQAEQDAFLLRNSLLRFDCDCGRHTYWYRYIASVGKFAYIGTNPLGRKETGFPKIRNPNLKGIACKHVLRTMQTVLRDKSVINFLVKAILRQWKFKGKNVKTNNTKKELIKTLQRQTNDHYAVLSNGEKFIAPKLLERYRNSLERKPTSSDRKSLNQKLSVLSQVHSIDALIKLMS